MILVFSLTEVDGGVFTIPKYILDTRVNILFLEFRVMFGSKIIVLKRILEIINRKLFFVDVVDG